MDKNKPYRIVMLLENASYPHDCRVLLEATSLVEAGHRVSVVGPTSKCDTRAFEILDGVYVYRYPAPIEFDGVLGYVIEFSYSFIVAWLYSTYILLRHGFDAVHIHMPPDLNGLLGAYYRLLGKKFVMDHHDLSPELFGAKGKSSSILLKLLLFFERTSCRWANRLISTNSTQRNTQIDRGGARPEHCAIVRNGPADFFLDGDQEPIRLAEDPETKIIGYVGAMGSQDGVDSLVRVAHHLKTSLNRSDFLVVIVGSGPAVPDLKALVNKLDLNDLVMFTGLVPFPEVPSYIKSFDICVTPDPSNPYNDSCTTIKTMEYMALCKPTVAFDTFENRVTAQDAALYAANNDELEFARKLSKLMDDSQMREFLGQKGRQRIERSLSWAKQKDHLLEVYDSLIRGDNLRAFAYHDNTVQAETTPSGASSEVVGTN